MCLCDLHVDIFIGMLEVNRSASVRVCMRGCCWGWTGPGWVEAIERENERVDEGERQGE